MTQLPDRINRLDSLARDLWWSWTPDARSIFRRLDYNVWRQTAHNPVRMLQMLPPEAFEGAMADPSWLAAYDRVVAHQDSSRSEHHSWD